MWQSFFIIAFFPLFGSLFSEKLKENYRNFDEIDILDHFTPGLPGKDTRHFPIFTFFFLLYYIIYDM